MPTTLYTASHREMPQELAGLAGHYARPERELIEPGAARAAAAPATLRTPEGESLGRHAFGVAEILGGLKLDHESIVAALLLGQPPATAESLEQLRAQFG